MRALVFSLLLLVPATDLAFAQGKAAPKAASGPETRYFTAIDGFMDSADVQLKETRQAKTVTAAVLDVCFVPKGGTGKDRFVANLTVEGATLSGTTQSIGGKTPVTIKLARKANGETFDFKGQVAVGTTTYDIASTDNSDLSEKEFRENQTTDDGIAAAPKDFTEVSPEAVGVKVSLEAAADFLKTLRGQNVEVALSTLEVGCDALRAGTLVLNLAVDPERAAAVIAAAKAFPGVASAGWIAGAFDMDRTVLFPAQGFREAGKLNHDKIAATVAGVVSQAMSAKLASSTWNETTGKLKLTFKRPSPTFPQLQLTDTIEIEALVSADKPGGAERLMLWLGNPSITTTDDSAGAKLALKDDTGSDEEAEPLSDGGAVAALAKELKGQRWDSESSTWQ